MVETSENKVALEAEETVETEDEEEMVEVIAVAMVIRDAVAVTTSEEEVGNDLEEMTDLE